MKLSIHIIIKIYKYFSKLGSLKYLYINFILILFKNFIKKKYLSKNFTVPWR